MPRFDFIKSKAQARAAAQAVFEVRVLMQAGGSDAREAAFRYEMALWKMASKGKSKEAPSAE